MFPIQDQISVATRTALEDQIALYTSLHRKTLDSVARLVDLNITAVKASMSESTGTMKQILAAKDPQEILSLMIAQARPNVEKALAYGGHVASIASSTQSEFTRAVESQIAQTRSKANELVDAAMKKAPAGSEGVMAVMKTAFANANAGYEQMSRAGKQAMEAVEANLAGASAKVSPAGATPATPVDVKS